LSNSCNLSSSLVYHILQSLKEEILHSEWKKVCNFYIIEDNRKRFHSL